MLACGSGEAPAHRRLPGGSRGALESAPRRPAAPARRFVGGARAWRLRQTGDQRHVVFQRRRCRSASAHHDRVGQADRIRGSCRATAPCRGPCRSQEAERSRRHRQQALRHVHLAFADQRAQRFERRPSTARRPRIVQRGIDRPCSWCSARSRRAEADDRIAAAQAALHDSAGRSSAARRRV